jgi:hypothetical protein
MTRLAYRDFLHPVIDTDRSPQVKEIYRHQFPKLYQAVNNGELKTPDGKVVALEGDTLITYKRPIRRIYEKYFGDLDSATQKTIQQTLEAHSHTAEKRIKFWDGVGVVNNHQIGNMMPFPSSQPSMNVLRAGSLYDYFDKFLAEVQSYFASRTSYQPTTSLQRAIYFQREYFDFFKTYDKYIEDNLLQDFVGKDLWGISDFHEFVSVASDIIDRRGKRFTAVVATY